MGPVWRYQGPRGVVWRIRYRDATGRRILETLGKEPQWDRKRAETEHRRRLVDVERDGYRKPDNTLFADFAEQWLTDHLPGRGLKLTTTDSYTQTVRNHLIPYFGRQSLTDLERHPELIDRYISEKIRSGLAPKTVTNHLLCLQVMLKRAVRWRLITHNPVPDCDRPASNSRRCRCSRNRDRPPLGRLPTAHRPGRGRVERAWWRIATPSPSSHWHRDAPRRTRLRWKDIQLPSQLTVREAFVRGRFTTPRAGLTPPDRTRPAPTPPRPHWQTSYRADDDLVFSHPEKGTPLDASKLARVYLRPALKAANITRPFRPFHDLRHTALTREAAAGNPQAYIQLKAGHSQGQITERYIHAAQLHFPGAAAKAEERMFGSTAQLSPDEA
jgi:site-specific recombinase XerD